MNKCLLPRVCLSSTTKIDFNMATNHTFVLASLEAALAIIVAGCTHFFLKGSSSVQYENVNSNDCLIARGYYNYYGWEGYSGTTLTCDY